MVRGVCTRLLEAGRGKSAREATGVVGCWVKTIRTSYLGLERFVWEECSIRKSWRLS